LQKASFATSYETPNPDSFIANQLLEEDMKTSVNANEEMESFTDDFSEQARSEGFR
jgi:hypothetical protein